MQSGSAVHPQVGQSVAQFFDSCIGDPCFSDIEQVEVHQTTKLQQPGVSHACTAKIEVGKIGQALEVNQPGVGDLCAHESERPQLGQPSKLEQPGVGNLGVVEVQVLEIVEIHDVLEPRVADDDDDEMAEVVNTQGFYQPTRRPRPSTAFPVVLILPVVTDHSSGFPDRRGRLALNSRAADQPAQ